MFVRVDVVLAVHWSEDGEEMFAQPMINEMDWFNSAAQMIPHWPSNASAEASADLMGRTPRQASPQRSSSPPLTRGHSTDRIIMVAQLSSRSMGLGVKVSC